MMRGFVICTLHQFIYCRSNKEECDVRGTVMLGERRDAYRILVGRPEERITLGRPRRKR
jgi:hypothetical protein